MTGQSIVQKISISLFSSERSLQLILKKFPITDTDSQLNLIEFVIGMELVEYQPLTILITSILLFVVDFSSITFLSRIQLMRSCVVKMNIEFVLDKFEASNCNYGLVRTNSVFLTCFIVFLPYCQ